MLACSGVVPKPFWRAWTSAHPRTHAHPILTAQLLSGALNCFLPLARLPQPLSILRPLLVIETHVLSGVRRVLRQIVLSFWHLRWMLILLQALILIFAILA